MKYLFSAILCIDGILGLYLAISYLWSSRRGYRENFLLAFFSMFSGIWSLGFGMLFVQTNEEYAYYWRSFGIFGTVGFMVTIQILICYISQIDKRIQRYMNGLAWTGVIVYLLAIQRDQTSYKISTFGMTYKFKAGIVNNIYTAYFLIVAFNILLVIIYMIRKSPLKRIRTFGMRFLWVEILVLGGTILDMIFPALGLDALPGSNVTQFIGLIVVYMAMKYIDDSRINVQNMSSYIYYSMSDPVLMYDVDKRLKVANDAAADFLMIEQAKIEERDYALEKFFDFPSETFVFEGKTWRQDVKCKHNDVPCSVTINVIEDKFKDRIGYIVIVKDISERIKVLKLAEDAKYEADKANQAKTTFLANMSHEIRTPMNAIMGFSELSLHEEMSETARDYIKDIKNSSESLLAIINAILDISKIESGKMELIMDEFWTSAVINEAVQAISLQLKEKGLEFIVDVDKDLPAKLYGDSTKLREILVNLLNNAYKYTNQGYVKLSIKRVKTTGQTASLEFKISDSGIGIKEDDLKYLYEKFSRVDQQKNNRVEGTGLGLSIVKSYIDMMDGTILVSSIYEKGTVFTVNIDLDIVDNSPILLEKVNKEGEETGISDLKVKNARVLVVDDNTINIKVISSTMKKYGLDTTTAGGGAEAIELCKDNDYDIVFMDQMMPEMDGIEAMRQIRKLKSHYASGGPGKIVVLTANAILGVREELLGLGFDDYLEKPMDFRELEKLFKKYISDDNLVIETKENSLDNLKELMPEIDVEKGIENSGGMLEVYMEVLELEVEEAAESLEKLQSMYEAGDWENFTVLAHSLKSTAKTIGASETSEKAKGLEYAGKDKDKAYVDAHLADFKEDYMAFTNILRRAVDAN